MSTERNANPGARASATGAECKAERLRTEDSTTAPPRKAYRAQAAWRERNPVAHWAHKAFESGLKRKLIATQPCEVCGDPKAEGHHSDCRLPLEVQWLCRKGQVIVRRAMIVDAVLASHAAGLTVAELVDLLTETEEALVFVDRDEVARARLKHQTGESRHG